MRRTIYLGSGFVILAASFLATLWLTAPKSAPEEKSLADGKVSNYAELGEAAAAVGLRSSQVMKGNVDAIKRADEREVTIAGWVADPEGDATPVQLLVFVAGRLAVTAKTQGERPDVTQTMGLAFGSEKNILFSARFACQAGEQPVIAALGSSRQYLPLSVAKCP